MAALIQYNFRYLWRKQRFLVLCAVGFLMAALSALTARYLPEILQFALALDGFESLPFPESTTTEAYAQFVGNMNQIFMWVVIFMGASYLHEEERSGFSHTYYATPISAWDHGLSKVFPMFVLIFTASALASGFFALYTWWLFGTFFWSGLVLLSVLLTLANYVIYAVMTLVHALTKRFAWTVLAGFAIYTALSLLTLLSGDFFRYFPQALMQAPFEILTTQRSLGSGWLLALLYIMFADGLIYVSMAVTRLRPGRS